MKTMYVCSGSYPGHPEIVYTDELCPVCELMDDKQDLKDEIKELEKKNEKMDDELSELEGRIADLKNEIENLE